MVAVAIYTRLSKDPTGEQTSTPRQERLCRAYAEARGWSTGAVFEDVDLSAYRRGLRRPAFEALSELVDDRGIDGVLCWKLDRLFRRPADFEQFWSMCEYRGVFLASVTEPVDSSTELGIAIVRLLVTFAGLESSTKSVRQKARSREQAEAGIPHACRGSFGWIGRYEQLHPIHAPMIQEAASRVLGGASLNSIATDWNARGLPIPRQSPWTAGSVISLLRKPALTGDRTLYGVVTATDCWPAVLDRTTFARVQLAIDARRRPANGHREPYLLAGLMYCNRCNARLGGLKDRGRRRYACPRPPTGCSGVSVPTDSLEQWLLEECARRDAPPAPSAAEMIECSTKLRQLAEDFYARQVISREEFAAARAAIAHDEPTPYDELPMEGDILTRQLFVRNRISRIVVHAGRARRPFDPERLEISWRTEPVRLYIKKTRPRLRNGRLDADEWLTGDEARHVLCDMNLEHFQDLVSSGKLNAWRARGARLRRSDVDRVLGSLRYRPTSK